jgi:UDP-N-acetylglucosamine enolpyruvyl transferase
MNILLVNASPKGDRSNTLHITDAFLAGLMSGGETRVHNIGYIDRGYEYLDSKFKAIGAEIVRVDED